MWFLGGFLVFFFDKFCCGRLEGLVLGFGVLESCLMFSGGLLEFFLVSWWDGFDIDFCGGGVVDRLVKLCICSWSRWFVGRLIDVFHSFVVCCRRTC